MIKTINDISKKDTKHSIVLEKDRFVISVACDRQDIIVFHRSDMATDLGVFQGNFDGMKEAIELIEVLINE